MYRYHELPGRPADWDDLIRGYDTKTLFHEAAWLDHLLSIHPDGRIDYYEIRDGGSTVGYHCGVRITKMGVPIHGSPLGGTGTNYMGPIVNRDADQKAVVDGLVGLMGLRTFVHLELSHFWLDPDVMATAEFETHSTVTHLIRLSEDEEEAWAAMKGTARNRVRKARKHELVAEVTDDPAIVDEFYAEFTEVYAKQDMVTPFGKERVQSLREHLLPAGRLLVLQVRHEETVVATGFFPFDENCIYFWGAASWLKYQKLCPNELLHWTVIEHAVKRGIPAYNMCGGQSRFKDKFGGEDVPYRHFSKSGLPGLGVARDLYRKLHFYRLKREYSDDE